MEAKHTPGPWAANDQEVWATRPMRFNGISAGMPMIASVCRHDDAEGGFPTAANARLLAAAPELLQALEALDNYISNNLTTEYPTGLDIEGEPFKAARAAIAKALGHHPTPLPDEAMAGEQEID